MRKIISHYRVRFPVFGDGDKTNHVAGVSNDSSISIARAETRAVNRSKIVVLVVIAIAASSVVQPHFFTKSEGQMIL
jgi:hypothetical protein